MWEDEPDLTPEPWHTADPMPWLGDDDNQADYWNAPSAEDALAMVGPAYTLWATQWEEGPCFVKHFAPRASSPAMPHWWSRYVGLQP